MYTDMSPYTALSYFLSFITVLTQILWSDILSGPFWLVAAWCGCLSIQSTSPKCNATSPVKPWVMPKCECTCMESKLTLAEPEGSCTDTSSLITQVFVCKHGWLVGYCESGCVFWSHHVLHLQELWPTWKWWYNYSWSGNYTCNCLITHHHIYCNSHTIYYVWILCLMVKNVSFKFVNQMLPYLVMDILAAYPGIPGLFVAAAYSGTLRWDLKPANKEKIIVF